LAIAKTHNPAKIIPGSNLYYGWTGLRVPRICAQRRKRRNSYARESNSI